jgi:hypothetical protein
MKILSTINVPYDFHMFIIEYTKKSLDKLKSLIIRTPKEQFVYIVQWKNYITLGLEDENLILHTFFKSHYKQRTIC